MPQNAHTNRVTVNGILVPMRRMVALLLATGCTTLGPMPSTTGVSAIPAGRPAGEVQLGGVPAFHLSSAASTPRGGATGQAAVLVEPDRWIKAPGLVVGGRLFGKGEDTPVEPLIGYRKALGQDFAWAIVGYGTSKHASQKLASYHGFRAGAEVAADGKIVAFTRWLSLHAQAAASLTRVVGSGKYCVDDKGVGKDCSEDMPETNVFVNGQVTGWFPTATATVALDVGRHGSSWFHSLRVALMMSTGRMPHAVDGEQQDDSTYFALGALATLGIGE